MTFSFHLFLFPAGLTSLYLCFRVATAALWIMETPHPYSKQHAEAQMLAHKHTSISVSNLWCANSRWGWLLSRLGGNNLFTCAITSSTSCSLWGLWWSCTELHIHSFYFVYSIGGQNNGNILSIESKASVQRVKMLPLCVLLGGLDPSSLLWSKAKHTSTFTATLLPASCADKMRSQAPII